MLRMKGRVPHYYEGVNRQLQEMEAALRRHYAGRRAQPGDGGPQALASLSGTRGKAALGPAPFNWDRWWPARSRFEVVAGAILVQNTNWDNVVKALAALRAAGCLSLAGVRGLSEAELGRLIRSSGCWRQKAKRL
ncbi:MAG TPA: hypothetical protein VFP94_00475, partial [Terriglobales bacterium]|nr:hypothetical protein [Terriglobales bacterium]